jgi:hypothetical protein
MSRLRNSDRTRSAARAQERAAYQLTDYQKQILDRVIGAARQTPGALRTCTAHSLIFTALQRSDGTSWTIQTASRQAIAEGVRP